MKRRSFMASLFAAGFAAAMPRFLFPHYVLYGDGKHDDTTALQAWFDRQNVYLPDGTLIGDYLPVGEYRLSDTIILRGDGGPRIVHGSYFQWTKRFDIILRSQPDANQMGIHNCFLMNGGWESKWPEYRATWLAQI